MRPEAAPAAYEALAVVCGNPRALTGESYMPLLEACLQYLERYKLVRARAGTLANLRLCCPANCFHLHCFKCDVPPSFVLQQNVEAALQYLDLVESLFNWLVMQQQQQQQGSGGGYEDAPLSGAPSPWGKGHRRRPAAASLAAPPAPAVHT